MNLLKNMSTGTKKKTHTGKKKHGKKKTQNCPGIKKQKKKT